MVFVVSDNFGVIRHCGRNWPMARSALDYLVSLNIVPGLEIYSDAVFYHQHPALASYWLHDKREP